MIIALGDSITAGQHLTEGWSWPHLLERADVAIRGVPGDTTRLALERFPKDVQQYRENRVGNVSVIIQFGHNDCNRWDTDRGLPRVSPLAFRANLIEMIDRARNFYIRPLLCTLTPSHRSKEHAQQVERYDHFLRRVAEDEDVTLIDVRGAFFVNDGVETGGLLMDDGLHLTSAGHAVYANAVMTVLDAENIR